MIVKPEELDFSNKNLNIVLYGLPGVGKTTLALSAPNPVLVDTDEGIVRIKPEHRKASTQPKTYEELLADLKTCEGQFETVIIDTTGALIELMKEWAMRTEPSANKRNGGFSQQGFGIIKTEYLRLCAELRKKFHVISIFHATKDKNGEDVFYDLVCEGSAKTLVWQPADLGAYLHIMNGERYLGFTPTANYNAKSAYGISGLIKLPELGASDQNDFFTRLFARIKENINAESAELNSKKKSYDDAMKSGKEILNALTASNIDEAKEQLSKLEHSLTSKAELTALLKQKIIDLGLAWNAKTKKYEPKQ